MFSFSATISQDISGNYRKGLWALKTFIIPAFMEFIN
jgi:hypothetical protein